MILRSLLAQAVRDQLRAGPVVALIGARQVGKTTLARLVAGESREPVHVFDLEDPDDLARLSRPMDTLRDLTGLVVIDEIHRRPDLFPVLRVLADRRPLPARFLVLGSASIDLLRQRSESLAGRIAFVDLGGLSIAEVGADHLTRLWMRGGFPRSFTANSDAQSLAWRRNFARTFFEHDARSFGIQIEPQALLRFWRMFAHYHGQVWNAAEFARSFGVAESTMRRYLDVLDGLLVVRRLQPWFENLKKRQVKAPKIYVGDSGMLHALLDVGTRAGLDVHPKLGASWEGFALEQVALLLRLRREECYFWALHSGAELDLLVERGGQRVGFEFKYTASPTFTASMRSSVDALRLDRLVVVHPGQHRFTLGDRARAVPLVDLAAELTEHGVIARDPVIA